jgi:hypothetical protein
MKTSNYITRGKCVWLLKHPDTWFSQCGHTWDISRKGSISERESDECPFCKRKITIRKITSSLNGIEISSGINDCHWNLSGKCINKIITDYSNKTPINFSANWHSKKNCTLTQFGVYLCSEYIPAGLFHGPEKIPKFFKKFFLKPRRSPK